MLKKNKDGIYEFPEGFFDLPRPTISWEEATKDDLPFDWSEEDFRKHNRSPRNKNLNSELISKAVVIKLNK